MQLICADEEEFRRVNNREEDALVIRKKTYPPTQLVCTDKEGFRRVNNREEEALIFTFGIKVGTCLIDGINLEYDPTLAEDRKAGRVRTDWEIQMRSDYSPEDLEWLGIFIHEAAHIWQRETERHQEGRGGENYTYYYTQLPPLKLETEEHARAIQDWFYVTYGITKGLAGSEHQVSREWVWERILKAFGFDPEDNPNLGEDVLKQLLEIWRPVIEEIRDPNKFPGC